MNQPNIPFMGENESPENIARDQQEMFDLVDDDNNVIGIITRDQAMRQNIRNVRSVELMVKNSKGEWLVMRRSANKRVAPLALDFPVGGYVQAGESYDLSLQREYEEETGQLFDASRVKFHSYLTPKGDGTCSFVALYEMHSDDEPKYNPDDFVGYEWAKPEVLLARLEAGEAAKTDMIPVLRRLYGTNA